MSQKSADLLIQDQSFLKVTWLFALEEISIGRNKKLEKSYKQM